MNMDLECIKREFLTKFRSDGDNKFYKYLLFCAVNKLTKDSDQKINVSLEYMNLHDKFMILFRREGDVVYLNIARLFRKAGHKVYRLMLKRGWSEKNYKFLNVV